jgi:putative endonuclease
MRQLRLAAEHLAAWAARRMPEWRSMPAHLATGHAGERAALFHLRRNGYTVVARRWSSGAAGGDIDIVAWHGATLCFVEVKTRTARDMAPAEAAVDEAKRKTLRRLPRAYLRHLPGGQAPNCRFDILSVYLLGRGRREILHYEGAFPWAEPSPG